MDTPPRNPPGALLQHGIYYQRGIAHPSAWRSLFIDAQPGARPQAVHAALASVFAMLTRLQSGETRDLGPVSAPPNACDHLLGFGPSFFDPERHQPPITTRERPDRLVYLRRHGPAFPSIPWTNPKADEPSTCGGEADFLLQLTGTSDHATSRAAVEVSHLIRDEDLALTVKGTYDGFLRDDGRSWIGFHDGVSNIEPSERAAAIECTGDPGWNHGGTYLGFLRLQLAIDEWRAMPRATQELIVGRDKLTGWPIGAVTVEDGQLQPIPIGDAPLTDATNWRMRDAYFNPPETGDPILEASHTHRSNQNKGSGSTRAAHRIFRQGYEYLDDIDRDGPRLGLNFISFQNDLQQLQQVLGLHGWLGNANFGGTTERDHPPQSIPLATLRAGGLYAVPPRAEPFPGADLFEV